MITKEYLILFGGVLHFLTLIASAMVPKTLDWKGELAKLMPFLRTLFWVYGAFIVLTIIAFGVLSVLHFRELGSDNPTLLARSVCAFLAIFWGVRLVVALFGFDVSEYLTTWYFKLGYHERRLPDVRPSHANAPLELANDYDAVRRAIDRHASERT